jgi:hypothetical protein
VFSGLDADGGADSTALRSWITTENTALQAVQHVDHRRARRDRILQPAGLPQARGMSLPSVPLLRTAFSVRIDLAKPTLSRDAAVWTDPTRYDPSQELADRAPRQPDSSQTWAPVRRRDRRAGLP